MSVACGSLALPAFLLISAGVTFSLTVAGAISSPSNTPTGLVVDLTTFTSTSTVVS